MLLTTSKDSTVKVFTIMKLYDREKTRFNFDRTEDYIKRIIYVEKSHIITQCESSKY